MTTLAHLIQSQLQNFKHDGSISDCQPEEVVKYAKS